MDAISITVVALAILSTKNSYVSAQTLNQLLELECPDPKRPIFCRPYGDCCGYDEFCSKDSRRCESCFPREFQDSNDSLLQWCREIGQFNSSFMNDASCQVACQAMFNSKQLNKEPSLSNDCVAWDDPPHIVLYLFLGVLLMLSSILFFLTVYCCVRGKQRSEPTGNTGLVELGHDDKSNIGVQPRNCDAPESDSVSPDEKGSQQTVSVHNDETSSEHAQTDTDSTHQESVPLINRSEDSNSKRSKESTDSALPSSPSETTSDIDENTPCKQPLFVSSPAQNDISDRPSEHKRITSQTSYHQ